MLPAQQAEFVVELLGIAAGKICYAPDTQIPQIDGDAFADAGDCLQFFCGFRGDRRSPHTVSIPPATSVTEKLVKNFSVFVRQILPARLNGHGGDRRLSRALHSAHSNISPYFLFFHLHHVRDSLLKRSRGLLWIVIIAILVMGACDARFRAHLPSHDTGTALSDASSSFLLGSSAFDDGEDIPVSHTCDGKNVSPSLSISGVPESTKSLALIVEDPDAPGGTFVHWAMWNIDPATAIITEGFRPQGAVEGPASNGQPGYAGPCPPSGVHRYIFTLYALPQRLDLPVSTTGVKLQHIVEPIAIARATLIGTYGRELSGTGAAVAR